MQQHVLCCMQAAAAAATAAALHWCGEPLPNAAREAEAITATGLAVAPLGHVPQEVLEAALVGTTSRCEPALAGETSQIAAPNLTELPRLPSQREVEGALQSCIDSVAQQREEGEHITGLVARTLEAELLPVTWVAQAWGRTAAG